MTKSQIPMTNKKISKIFFYIFVFLLPWQTRMIFTPEKTEFLSFSIYLAEIFLWLALAFWLTGADLKKIPSNPPFQKGGMGGILLLCFFVFLSIAWSSDRVPAFRLWLFVFDGIMVYLFLQNFASPLKVENVQNQTPPLKVRGGWGELWNSKTGLIYVFLFSLFIAALFGIWQFFNLGSPAWKWLGLAARGAWNLGDIVIATGGERWLRAYGPFPHPNIFGGYLAAGLIILFNEIKKITKVLRSYEFCYIYFLAAVLFFALFLTFSRSAWLALAISMFFLPLACPVKLLATQERSGVIKGEARRGILKFILFLSVLAITLLIIFFPFIKTRATSAGWLEQKSNTERVGSWRDGLATWYQNPIFGSGVGSGVIASSSEAISLKTGSPRSLQSLAMTKKPEPPHNIFILVLTELGVFGFFIYLFVWKKFWKNPAMRPFLILFFVIGMFDHYLWTLWSGQMLFWLSLSLNNAE